MMLLTYRPQQTSPADFVRFWASHYNDTIDGLYTDNIGQPLTADRVHQLFIWKNGSRLSEAKRRSVDINYVAHIPRLAQLPRDIDARQFLDEFAQGGAIWRIFWLHCWQPDRFPIYDQHVHRAMVLIEDQRLEEIPTSDTKKVELYIDRYLPLHGRFQDELRSVDKALWYYGKFLKSTRFPVL